MLYFQHCSNSSAERAYSSEMMSKTIQFFWIANVSRSGHALHGDASRMRAACLGEEVDSHGKNSPHTNRRPMNKEVALLPQQWHFS